jgi:hypothetical protein
LEDAILVDMSKYGGSGKTSSILLKIIHHMNNKDFKSNSDFLILTLKKNICDMIITRGNFINNNTFSKDNVRTYESLFSSIMKLNNTQCNSAKIASLSSIQIIKKKSVNELKSIKFLTNVKLVIINDKHITKLQKNVVFELKKKLDFKLICIFDFLNLNALNLNALNLTYARYYFAENYRCDTNAINKPSIYINTASEICKKIVDEINTKKYAIENIAIVCFNKKGDIFYKLINIFAKNNINIVKYYSESPNDHDDSDIYALPEKGKINFCDVNGIKGMEFDKIIIIDFYIDMTKKTTYYEDYNKFLHKWDYIMSRSKNEIMICMDKNKIYYNIIFSKYQIPISNILKDVKIVTPMNYYYNDIEKITLNKEYFGDDALLNIHNQLKIKEKTEKLFDIGTVIIDNSTIDEIFLKYVFEYYYSIFHGTKLDMLSHLDDYLTKYIFVGDNANDLEKFMDKLLLTKFELTTIEHIYKFKNKFNEIDKIIFEQIVHKSIDKMNSSFSLMVHNENNNIVIIDKLKKYCQNIKHCINNDKVEWNILKLLNKIYDFNKKKEELTLIIINLKHIINNIKSFVCSLKNGYKFKIKTIHPNLLIMSTIDIILENGIIIKIIYTDKVTMVHKLQIFLQYHCYYNKWSNTKSLNKIEIWNFKTGIRHQLDFDPVFSNLDVSYGISILCNRKLENIIFVYDLETTGLNVKLCEIIERYFHEMCHDVEFSSGIIKPKGVVSKEIQDLTGITKKDIDGGENVIIMKKQMTNFLAQCRNPIFIAHNGNVFDHQIMKNYKVMTNDCKYLDCRMLIRQVSVNKVKGESLKEIYEIVMGYKYKGKAHRARADVMMLLDIFKKLDINEKFLMDLMN